MGPRARAASAAAACLVTSWLLVGGAGTAIAFADPGRASTDGTTVRSPNRPSSSDRKTDNDARTHPPKKDSPNGPKDPPTREPDRDPCCEKGKDCGPGWPWPFPAPDPDPDQPPTSENETGDGLPAGLPGVIQYPGPAVGLPPLEEPPAAEPLFPDVVDVVPGVGAPVGAPVSVPILVAAPAGLGAGPAGGGAGPAGGGAGPKLPAAPRHGTAEPPPARQPLPATAGTNIPVQASSYRVGYGEYLRSAGMSQIAVLAVPGVAGILILTGAGGLVGYRQAKAGRAVRTNGITRFMN